MRANFALKPAGYFAIGAFLLAGLVAITVPSAVEAQRYRDDVPNVLPKQPKKEQRFQRDDQRHLDDFRSIIGRKNRHALPYSGTGG